MRYFSMFSGIAGFELGIQYATDNKWECVGYSEIDKYAIQCYSKHFPGHRNYGDATKIVPEELPDFDLLCGGFPCQSFSIAGKRLGFEDTRGTLFFDIARIIKRKRPRYVFLENVKGLLNHDNGRTFATILATLSELRYDCEWEVLNSKHFGVPQNRERVFIIGHLRGTSGRQVFPLGEVGSVPASEIRGQQGEEPRVCSTIDSRYGALRNAGETYIQTTAVPVLTPGRMEKRQNGRRFKDDGEDMFTLNTQDVHGVMVADFRNDEGLRIRKGEARTCLSTRRNSETDISTMSPLIIQKHHSEEIRTYAQSSPTLGKNMGGNSPKVITHNLQPRSPDRPSAKGSGSGHLQKEDGTAYCLDKANNQAVEYTNKIRRLTPVECARLQGFPDDWHEGLSDTQAYKCYGNAVTVNVIETIVSRMMEVLDL